MSGYITTEDITSMYSRGRAMFTRCFDARCKSYPNYGGRGITVCIDWVQHPWKYIEWLHGQTMNWRAEHGSEAFEVDRIDNNSGYSPENCRLVSRKDNMRNKRSNTLYRYKDEDATLLYFIEKYELDISAETARVRIASGWSVDEALETPIRARRNGHDVRRVVYDGHEARIGEHAVRNGLNPCDAYSRLRAGWTVEEALSTPKHTRKPGPPTTVFYTYKGEQLSVKQLLERATNGISRRTFYKRIRRDGFSVEDAITIPLRTYPK